MQRDCITGLNAKVCEQKKKKKAKLTSLLGLSKSTSTKAARWCLGKYKSTRTCIGLWFQSWDQAAESLKAKLDVRPSLLLRRYMRCPPALSDTHQQRRTDNVLFVSEKIFKCNWRFEQVQTNQVAIIIIVVVVLHTNLILFILYQGCAAAAADQRLWTRDLIQPAWWALTWYRLTVNCIRNI